MKAFLSIFCLIGTLGFSLPAVAWDFVSTIEGTDGSTNIVITGTHQDASADIYEILRRNCLMERKDGPLQSEFAGTLVSAQAIPGHRLTKFVTKITIPKADLVHGIPNQYYISRNFVGLAERIFIMGEAAQELHEYLNQAKVKDDDYPSVSCFRKPLDSSVKTMCWIKL